MSDGRLAQLVAHPLDVREVTSSSLVSSTTDSALKSAESFLWKMFFGAGVLSSLQGIGKHFFVLWLDELYRFDRGGYCEKHSFFTICRK